MRTLLLGGILALVLIPAAQTQPPGFDPVGKWTFSTHDESGNPLSGTMEIKGQPGNYEGEATLNGMDQKLPIKDVATSANGFLAIADTGDGAAVVKIWKGSDGKLQCVWGPVKQIIPATIERAR